MPTPRPIADFDGLNRAEQVLSLADALTRRAQRAAINYALGNGRSGDEWLEMAADVLREALAALEADITTRAAVARATA